MIPTRDLVQIARGFLMGGADIIPGVSGGTVALILGIYSRLVKAISRFDLTFLSHVGHRRWREAAEYVDLRFLVTLFVGISLGISGLGTLMHWLLDHYPQQMSSAFFGLILASCVLVAQTVESWSWKTGVIAVGGAGLAYWLVGQLPAAPPEGNWYLFVCGSISICAMILPGISGAFILLILGRYHHMTGLLRDLLHGHFQSETLIPVAVFIVGIACGLLSFSKLLHWLLDRHESRTLAVLCGFMAGSLRKIWPFKVDQTPNVIDFKLKRFHNIWPDAFTADVGLALAIAVLAAGLVFALDRVTAGHEHVPAVEPDRQGE